MVTSSLPALCSLQTKEYLISQIYLLFVLTILFLFAWTSRRQSFSSNEGNHIFIGTSLILPIFGLTIVLCETFSDHHATATADIDNYNRNHEVTLNASNRDIVNSITMIAMAFISLVSLFGPILYTVHKYGSLPRKAVSYADSLSTAFTVFRGNLGGHGDQGPILSQDALSQNSSRSSSVLGQEVSPTSRRNRPAKRIDSGPLFSSSFTNSYNYYNGPNSNFRLSPRTTPLEADYVRRSYPLVTQGHFFGDGGHLMAFNATAPLKGKARSNPLYDETGQYRSAYP